MKDNYNREIDYLRISVTDNCNLNCFYCMPKTQTKKEILTDKEIITIIKTAVKNGIKKVRITGGEPLVRKGIYTLLKNIKNIKGVEELTITTNGILLKNYTSKIDNIVDRINLSIDSLVTESLKKISPIAPPFHYEELIREILDSNIKQLKINVVLLKGINDFQINDYINLSDKYDLTVRFIELMDIGELDYNYNDFFVSANEVKDSLKDIEFVKEDKNTSYYKMKDKRGLIGFINPISKKFCESCNRLRVTSDGNIRPCLHYDKEYNTKENIEKAFKDAIKNKPKEHKLETTKSKKSMNQIGG